VSGIAGRIAGRCAGRIEWWHLAVLWRLVIVTN